MADSEAFSLFAAGMDPERGQTPRSRWYQVGQWCACHPWLLIGLWVALLVLASVGHATLGGSYTDDFTLPGTPAQQGADLLAAHEPSAGGTSSQLVFTRPNGSLDADKVVIEQTIASVRNLPHVLAVSNPLSAATTSADGRVAYATLHVDRAPVNLGASWLAHVNEATAAARSAGVRVDYGGALGQAARPKTRDVLSEVIGIGVAVIVLLVGFGSVYAAGLPILSAVLSVFTGLGLLGILAATVNFASAAPTLAIMMGLGVGIDYALFLMTRHRQYVADGVEAADAAGRTVATSGRAVLTAALTVVIALSGLYASGIGFIGKLGLAAGVTVAVSAAGALTLLPALLGAVGRGIDRYTVRRPVAESAATSGGWRRHACRVGAHPWRWLLGGVTILAVLATPTLSLRLGHIGPSADPTNYTDRRAYDAINAGFGAGANGPFTVVVALNLISSATPADRNALASSLRAALVATPGVATVGSVAATPDGALLVTTTVPETGPADARTATLLTTLRNVTLPAVLNRSGAHGYVTGSTAAHLDFRNTVANRLPTILAVVVAAAFVLLLATFRSPLLAATAAILNLLSIGAAYGVVVAVFQWGWGSSILGISEKVPIESYVPMMMFAIVFGLSMDYEVFLLFRIREAWLSIGDNHVSVATGLAVTARVITCAALIMTSVFLAFLLSTNAVIKMLALGLGISVLIDATIIRLIIMPATMFLLGRANWWIPTWLDRLLPHLDTERPAAPVPAPSYTESRTRQKDSSLPPPAP